MLHIQKQSRFANWKQNQRKFGFGYVYEMNHSTIGSLLFHEYSSFLLWLTKFWLCRGLERKNFFAFFPSYPQSHGAFFLSTSLVHFREIGEGIVLIFQRDFSDRRKSFPLQRKQIRLYCCMCIKKLWKNQTQHFYTNLLRETNVRCIVDGGYIGYKI